MASWQSISTHAPDRFTTLPGDEALAATVVALDEHGFSAEVVDDLDAARIAVLTRIPGSYAMLDHTVYGRQESWENSPEGWPRLYLGTRSEQMRTDEHGRFVGRPGGRPIPQWPRAAAGHSDDVGISPAR